MEQRPAVLEDPARWGRPGAATPLPDDVGPLLSALGVRAARPQVGDVALAPSALPDEALAALRGACPDVRTDDATRLARAAGKSTVDLLRARAGAAPGAPDAVARPADHDEVVALLRACAGQRVAAVPFGGGTSVVAGLRADRIGYAGVVAVDLGALDRLRAVDPVSRTATLEAGLRGPRAEELLAAHGFTLGHFPQSFEYATIGGFAATRSSGQASAGYGRFDDLVVGMRVATPTGTLRLGRAPRSAAGPDLRQLFLGSEGAFGIVTEVTVQVRPAPTGRRYGGWAFGSFAAGTDAVRALAQDGPLPTVLRLSDETETAVGARGAGGTGGCLAVVGVEGRVDCGGTGGVDEVARRYAEVADRLTALGGTDLGPQPGEAWRYGRYAGPYLRDALLDAGALAETLETAAFWSDLPRVYAAVRAALVGDLTDQGTPPLVLCHVSHVYPAGASLYFTVLAAQADDPVAQWRRAKAVASDAIVAAGATITHHHGVGRDHVPWYAEEIGPLGLAALRAVKDAVDPDRILNPGVLLPRQ
jgi:alkyldihydroxyacetonephosphate synthase